MVMMITRFHGLIRSRVLWFFILGIIIVSFVGLYVDQGCTAGNTEVHVAGRLRGEPVSREAFADAYDHVLLSFVMRMGEPIRVNEDLHKEIVMEAWRRLAALREAEALGLGADDGEVLGSIQASQGFQDPQTGQFVPQAYQAFLQQLIDQAARSGVRVRGRDMNDLVRNFQRTFEDYVREEIALQKLNRLVQQNALISPIEMNRTLHALADTFEVTFAVLNPSNVIDEINVTEEDARTFFLANASAFTLPERVTVEYVAVPIEPFTDETDISEDEALDYYNANIDAFELPTNEVEETVAEIETDDAETGSEDIVEDAFEETYSAAYLPFEEARTSIVKQLALDAARIKAAERATDMVVELAPDRDGRALSFSNAAERFGWPILQAGPFAMREEVKGQDAGPSFNLAAFQLNDSPEDRFSDALIGSNAVYVLYLKERHAPRAPSFEEVREEALAAARAEALDQALAARAQALRSNALAAVEAGESFDETMRAAGLAAYRFAPFTIAEGPTETNIYADVVIGGMMTHHAGEVSEPIVTEDGERVLVYVVERVPADPSALQAYQPSLMANVKRQRGRLLFDAWRRGLIEGDALDDRILRRFEPGEDEEAFGLIEEDETSVD